MAYIYKITNLINNKIYIGETTRTIAARWAQHKYQSKSGETSHLHCAMRLYGADNFKIESIEFCKNEERFQRESYYIRYYNSLEPNGYNWLLYQCGAIDDNIELFLQKWNEGFTLTYISELYHTDAKRISRLLQGAGVSHDEIIKRKASIIGCRSSKKVNQYDLNGNFIQSFDSASEAGRILNINKASISRCAKHELLTYNNYIWQYSIDDNIEEIVAQLQTKTKTGVNKKIIYQFTLDNIFIKEYESASAAGRALGKSHAGIARAAREGRTAYGYRWKYKIDNQ